MNRLWFQSIDKMFSQLKIEDVVLLIEDLIKKMEARIP